MAKTLAETIETVRKLLALSTSSNAHEAANAAARANDLIDKYRLSMFDLEEAEVPVEPIVQDTDYIYQSGKVTVWKKHLMYTLTRHYGVAYWNDAGYNNGRKVSRYRMVGRKSDMDITRYMMSYLSLECERLSALEAKGTGLGRVFVSSYQEGFVAGITEQLRLSREAIKKEATSTAIVKIDSAYQEAEDSMYAMVPNLKTVKTRSYRRTDNHAYGMGKTRGQNIHLGSAMSAGSKIKLLSH